VSTQRCRHVTFMPSKGSSMRGGCKKQEAEQAWILDAFPSISSDTKHDHLHSTSHPYTLTPQRHTTLHSKSKQQHETKWPAEKVRSPTIPSRRAARARKDVSTDNIFSQERLVERPAVRLAATRQERRKSRTLRRLVSRYVVALRFSWDGTEARSGSSDGFARLNCVRAEFAR
jgi:hypothetical protein